MRKHEAVLGFIPSGNYIEISFLKSLLGRWAPSIGESDLDEIITQLLNEGVIFEPKPLCYQKIKMEAEKMDLVSDVYASAANFLNAKTVRSGGLIGRKLTIKDIEKDVIGQSQKEKLVISFDEIEQRLALNTTNARILAEAWGEEYKRWIGKQLMLQVTKRTFQGDIVDAIETVPM